MWTPHLKKWGVNWPLGPRGSAAPDTRTLLVVTSRATNSCQVWGYRSCRWCGQSYYIRVSNFLFVVSFSVLKIWPIFGHGVNRPGDPDFTTFFDIKYLRNDTRHNHSSYSSSIGSRYYALSNGDISNNFDEPLTRSGFQRHSIFEVEYRNKVKVTIAQEELLYLRYGMVPCLVALTDL